MRKAAVATGLAVILTGAGAAIAWAAVSCPNPPSQATRIGYYETWGWECHCYEQGDPFLYCEEVLQCEQCCNCG